MSEKMTAVTEKMNNLNRRTIAIILAVALVLSVFAGTGWFTATKAESESGRDLTVEDVEIFKFNYFSKEEATVYIGFLLNINDFSEEYYHTEIYSFLTGGMRNNKEKEELARLAYVLFSEYCINSNIEATSDQMHEAGSAINEYLKKKYGTDAENELRNELINEELSSLKDILMTMVSIATNTDMEEIEAVCQTYKLVKEVYGIIKDPEKKISEYYEKIKAVMDACKLFSSASRLDMYRQFSLYTQQAKMYLNFGNDSIVNAYCEMSQELLYLGGELANAAEYIESIPLLNNYCLNWNTDNRIKLLKKWAMTLAYCKNAAQEDVTSNFSEYELVKSTLTTSSSSNYQFSERIYNDKYSLRKQIQIDDLKYKVENNEVTIVGLNAPDGKYYDVEVPEKIDEYPVTKIGTGAFSETSLTSVVIPETVNTISADAFKNTIMSYIVIMGKKVSIAPTAFSWYLKSGNVTFKDVEIPVYAPDDSAAKQFAEITEGFEYHPLTWDGKTRWGVDYKNNIFNIWTANDLAFIQELVSLGYSLKGKTINLKADLDLGGFVWYPIGLSKVLPFSGNLSGNGYTINNLAAARLNNGNVAGVFGYVVGNNTHFENVTVRGVAKAPIAGGLIGQLYVLNDATTTIETVVSEVDVNASPGGGLLGLIECESKASNVYFKQCAFSGTIYCHGGGGYSGCQEGGLIGSFQNGNLFLEECVTQGIVKGIAYGPTVGGFIGPAKPHSLIVRNCECFAYVYSASTNGDSCLGGLVGGWSKENYDEASKWLFYNTYTSSVLDGAYAKGAFVVVFESQGYSIQPIVVKNCYFDISKNPDVPADRLKAWCMIFAGRNTVSNNVENSGGYSSNQLINNKDLYKEWDFEHVWEYAPTGMPKLRWIDYSACTEHTYVAETKAPTCTAKGYTTYTCRNCHYHYNDDYVNANGHSYQYTRTIEPSCTTQGYALYTCSVCNVTERRNAVPARGHSLTDIHTVAPTCTAKGYEEGVCSVCGATVKQNYINAAGHDNEVVKIVAPTCTEKGYTEYKCKTCGTVTKGAETAATGHSYTSQVAKEATCTEDGVRVKTCEACGDSYEETISKLGHNFTWASNMHIAPTCTAKGYTVQTCSRCGETQQVNELPTTGHDYGDVLGASHIATIYDANHRFKDSLAYTPNTVTANTVGSTPIESDSLFEAAWMTLPREIRLGMNDLSAMEGYYLSRQRQPLFFHSMETTIPAAFAYDASAGRAPEESALPYTDGKGNLYVVDGETITVSLSKEEALAKGILNDDGTVNVKTAIAEGYDLAYSAGLPGTYIILPDLEFESMLSGWNTPVSIFHYDGKGTASPGIYTVNYCFYNEKRSGLAGTTIKVYDTDALNYKTPATTDTPAQLHHRCIDCGEEVVEDITNNGELKIRASSLSLGNNLIMNFKVSQNTLEGFDDPYVEVLRNGKTTRITSFKEQGNDYVFSFENIAPQTMNDELSATLYATKDGALYGSSTLKTSVKSYAKFLLETYSSDKYAKLRTLVVDLLNYGAEAQKYRDYKTNDLVNAELTSEQRSWASGGDLSLSDITDSSYQTVETPVASWSSVALILDNSVTVRYKFTANDIDGMSIKVKYGDTGKEFDSSCFESLGEGTYSFKFSELSAHQMQVPLYATIYKDGEAVSNTFAYNVESYAARVKQTQPNTALGKLTDALMRYGFSATKYKNS